MRHLLVVNYEKELDYKSGECYRRKMVLLWQLQRSALRRYAVLKVVGSVRLLAAHHAKGSVASVTSLGIMLEGADWKSTLFLSLVGQLSIYFQIVLSLKRPIHK